MDADLTLAEAAAILQPPMSERQLRMIIAALGIKPAGRRLNGHPGKPHLTYAATTIMQVHAALLPWLDE